MRSLLFLVTLLFAFFSSTSASITLVTNFQEFRGSSNDATAESNCRALYNSRIEGCNDTEFQNGNYCTSDCQQALRNMEAKLNNFCKGVQAEDESLLAAIFGSKLVESICRDNGATGPQSSPRVSTTTKPVSTRTQQATITKSAEAGEDDEATTTLQVTSSQSVTLSSSTDTSTPQASFTPLPTPTTQQPAPAATTIGWRERVRQEQVCAILNGGGGSPFDQMVNFPTDDRERQRQLQECETLGRERSGGSHSHKPSSMVAIVIGVGIGLMLLA